MSKIRIGVLGPSDIAMRRMVPAIQKCDEYEYMGVAVAFDEEKEPDHDPEAGLSDEIGMLSDNGSKKAGQFAEKFGGMIYNGYCSMFESQEIDAVYIALPPALHHKWAKQALKCGKHVFLEKPFTTTEEDAKELISLARERRLAVTENFAFCYHAQIRKIKETVDEEVLGDIRIIRSSFQFPFRGESDFRYDKKLGGGALLDCGCYTLKLAEVLLGENVRITDHNLMYKEGYDVDMYGAVTAVGEKGEIAHLSFGMDQQYACDLEIWGSKGCLRSSRVYTPPADLPIELILTNGPEKKMITVDADDQFAGSARAFAKMITDDTCRNEAYDSLIRQSERVERCMK